MQWPAVAEVFICSGLESFMVLYAIRLGLKFSNKRIAKQMWALSKMTNVIVRVFSGCTTNNHYCKGL